MADDGSGVPEDQRPQLPVADNLGHYVPLWRHCRAKGVKVVADVHVQRPLWRLFIRLEPGKPACIDSDAEWVATGLHGAFGLDAVHCPTAGA